MEKNIFSIEKKDRSFGVVDSNDKVIIPHIYDSIECEGKNKNYFICFKFMFNNGYYYLYKNNKQLLHSNKPIVLLENEFILCAKNNKYGVMDQKRKIIIPFEYEYFYRFGDLISFPNSNRDYYLFNINGNFIGNFELVFENNLSIPSDVEISTKELYYNYNINQTVVAIKKYDLSEKRYKYGFINKNGKIILDCKYTDNYIIYQNRIIFQDFDGRIGSADISGNAKFFDVISNKINCMIMDSNNMLIRLEKEAYIVDEYNNFIKIKPGFELFKELSKICFDVRKDLYIIREVSKPLINYYEHGTKDEIRERIITPSQTLFWIINKNGDFKSFREIDLDFVFETQNDTFLKVGITPIKKASNKYYYRMIDSKFKYIIKEDCKGIYVYNRNFLMVQTKTGKVVYYDMNEKRFKENIDEEN